MDFGLKGKKALVCGGSKGLGRAIAEALAREQADVYLIGRDEASLNTAVAELKKLGNANVRSSACDLLSHSSRQKVIDDIKSTWGGLDILIHNVGGPKASFVESTSMEDWQQGFERLFLPVIDFNNAFLPSMKDKHWGRIVTITALAVVEPIPMLAVSNALRSASTAMSKTLSDEVAKYGVTVNCVAPGWFQTDRREELTQAMVSKSGQTRDEYEAKFHESIPVGRLGRVEEFGAVVCFLCSSQAAYLTGSTICVDGGKRRSTY